MVVGEVDTGKSTLVALLARWFLSTGRKAAIVDADIGQADIGPPGFVSYGFPEQDFDSLKAVTRRASYMAGNTSPYGRGLNVAAGVQACVRDAKREGADVIVIDTSGLVRGVAGRQLKCAKAETVRPDLIVILSTPGVETLAGHLEHLGFHVRRFLPIPGARAKAAEERKNSRISRWNSYLGSNLRLIAVDLSRVGVSLVGETRQCGHGVRAHGTVAAIQDPRRPGFHIPCVWMVAGKQEQSSNRPSWCPKM